jgi:uncharacterized protein YyaL (SSP411 family)
MNIPLNFASLGRFLLIGSLYSVLSSCGPPATSGSSRPKTEEVVIPTAPRAVNELSLATSPFLKRHAEDPIQWRTWGDEAFRAAAEAKKPLLVVVGYSSCPWTLKMQLESYTDKAVAEKVNSDFVPVLVDREAQPDVNQALQRFTFLTTNQSGWPMHMWMTPDGHPIHTGIYLPPASLDKSASFSATLEHVRKAWRDDPEYVKAQSKLRVDEFVKRIDRLKVGDGVSKLNNETIELAFEKLRSLFDPGEGGFSNAPKFPHYGTAEFLLNYAEQQKHNKYDRGKQALEMITFTLERMMNRALQDQLAGGFHRYSIDRGWTIPQFEKMLYDQGFLSSVYLRAYQQTGNTQFADVCRATLGYVMQELDHPAGGFYTAENAFSPKEPGSRELSEGIHYVWSEEDIKSALTKEEFEAFQALYGITDRGNLPIESKSMALVKFPDKNILWQQMSYPDASKKIGIAEPELRNRIDSSKKKLLSVRQKRPRPPRDEKVLPAWNATVISSMAKAGAVFQDAALLSRGKKAAEFTHKAFTASNYPQKRFLEDYVMMIQAYLDLYEATGELSWLQNAREFQKKQDAELWDAEEGAYWDGPPDSHLIIRTKSVDESTEFAPNAIASMNLMRMMEITGNADYRGRALALLQTFAGRASAQMVQIPADNKRDAPAIRVPFGPSLHVRLLLAYQRIGNPVWQYFIVGAPDAPGTRELAVELQKSYRPQSSLIFLDGGELHQELIEKYPTLKEQIPADGRPAVLCARNFQVKSVLTSVSQIQEFLAKSPEVVKQ